MRFFRRVSLSAMLAACAGPGPIGDGPPADPWIDIRASAARVRMEIADGMSRSGYHTRRNERYLLEFESGPASVRYSLSERDSQTHVRAKIEISTSAPDRSERLIRLSGEVQRFLDRIRGNLEAVLTPAASESRPPPRHEPVRPVRPAKKVLEKIGL